MDSVFLKVAHAVLVKTGKPMTVKEIMRHARNHRMFPDTLSGKTPHQTLKSKLSQEIRRNGDKSTFVRTAPGAFFLRSELAADDLVYNAVPWTKNTRGERVLVFDRAWLESLGMFQGIDTRGAKKLFRELLRSSRCKYLPRLQAETDDQHKQVLTYILVTRDDGAILSFRRGQYTNAEEFLKGSRCIGFGGHVTDSDRGLFTEEGMGVQESAIRELNEELTLGTHDRCRLAEANGLDLIGVLNDESSPVGKRHIAFVYRYSLSCGSSYEHIERGEQSVTQMQWLSPDSPPSPIWHFEYWSQLCLLKFAPELTRAAPSYQLRASTVLQPPSVICVLGAVGSGKSAASAHLSKQYGYEVVNTGRILAELLKIPPVPKTPRHVFQERALAFIERIDGPNLLADAIASAVRNTSTDRVVVDGIRHKETLRLFRERISPRGTGVMYVRTTPDVGYRLFCEREGKDRSLHEFFERLSAPVETEVEEMIADSDVVLHNWTGVVRYKKTMDRLMRDVGIEKRRR